MMGLYLQTLDLQSSYVVGTFVAVLFGLILFILMIIISIWIYMSFAYMSLAKKTKQKYPGLAWIPYLGPALIAFRSKKNHHWFPWILLVVLPIPILNIIALLTFFGFFTYWNWHLFERVHKPGWWSIFFIIPFGNIAYLALLGVAAWSKK